ncbi:MAG: HEPN domain-containing protein [Betaproteobacteria bacterium]|nr:HEPN domain-containing protein [Betaproteobacteria bacterium]
MSIEAQLEDAARWFAAARSDLSAAKVLQSSGHFALTCFHAQQCAEKAIKGLLVARGTLPKTHAIVRLAKELPERNEVIRRAERLDRYYVGTRYPDALPEGASADDVYDRDDAADAIGSAEGLLDLLSRWALAQGVVLP